VSNEGPVARIHKELSILNGSKISSGQELWYMSVILATWEAEIRKSTV
jgi:hypothetical protein